MSYRPQFPYKSPPKCEDQRCPYSFDSSNTPVLANVALAGGAQAQRIPLQLDKDADFYLRGIQVFAPLFSALEFRLEDPRGNPLSDTENASDTINFQYNALYGETDGAGIVALDSDDYGIYCDAGSRLCLYVLNNGTAPVNLTLFVVSLDGIKRYTGDRCAP